MKRKVATTVALLVIIALVMMPLPNGLAPEQIVMADAAVTASPLSAQERDADELDVLLRQDPDVQTLITVRDEMSQRALNYGVSTSTLRAAYQAKDEEQIAAMLGYSEEEIKTLNYRLDKARLAIFDRYPEIERMVRENPQNSCGYSPKTTSCETDRFFDNFSADTYNIARPTSCRYAPYVAALAVCTLAGPVWYWPCAYVALCSFCSGGRVDSICG